MNQLSKTKNGGDIMAVGFNHSRLNSCNQKKGWDDRLFRQKFIRECDEFGILAPSPGTMNNWISGSYDPKMKYMKVLSSLFGKPVDYFIEVEAA